MVYLFYTTYISVYLAHHEIFCAKVGKGGINKPIVLSSRNKTHYPIETPFNTFANRA